ncbi:MAG: MerR family transcriptional regulator [Acidobacteriota bacterium]
MTQRTGLTSHVLRAWERRYGVVEPERSEGGHRQYSDEDVERLKLLHELTRGGRQIGQIAHLDTESLRVLLREDQAAEATAPRSESDVPADADRAKRYQAEAFAAVGDLDPERLDNALRRAALVLATPAFLDDVLVPLMERIGDAWTEGELTPGHEHLASAVVARVTGWLIENFEPDPDAPCVVVGTPAGHRHELGAIAAAVTAASEGWRVRYLGPDLPAEHIGLVTSGTRARAVALSLMYPAADADVTEELRRLAEQLPPGTALIVGGRVVDSYGDVLDEIGAARLVRYRDLRAALRRLAESAG